MSLPYYRWFPGDYIRDTRRLSMLQHGAYRLLIDEYMVTGKPLPNDLPALYRICGAVSGEEHAAVRYVLEEFFRLEGPTWRHKRCDDEIKHANDRVESAKRSISARWKNRDTNVDTNVPSNEVRTKYEWNTNQNQNQIREKKEKKGASRLELPSWLPADVWADWHAYRSQRKGWTRKAQELSLHTLSDLHAEGCDPRDVVNRSIERGWTGLFPTKGKAAVGDDLMAGAL